MSRTLITTFLGVVLAAVSLPDLAMGGTIAWLNASRTEQFVAVETGAPQDASVSCPDGSILVQATVKVDSADAPGTFNDVGWAEQAPGPHGSVSFHFDNLATDPDRSLGGRPPRATAKLFATCVGEADSANERVAIGDLSGALDVPLLRPILGDDPVGLSLDPRTGQSRKTAFLVNRAEPTIVPAQSVTEVVVSCIDQRAGLHGYNAVWGTPASGDPSGEAVRVVGTEPRGDREAFRLVNPGAEAALAPPLEVFCLRSYTTKSRNVHPRRRIRATRTHVRSTVEPRTGQMSK